VTRHVALPLQIHPDKKLAAELHARDPKKFADANHKPEIAVALTPFLGFAGFAPFDRIESNLRSVPELAQFLGGLGSYTEYLGDPTSADKLKALVKDILAMNQKSSGLVESAKDTIKAVTGLAEPEKERGGGDAQGVVRSLIERIERDGPGAVFAGTMWNQEQRQRIEKALKKTQEFYAGDPGIIVAW
jgi:mannose-6-phosphate isomerase